MRYFATSLMPQAVFLGENIDYALARYQLAAGQARSKVVLDAGCGTGFGAEILTKTGAKKVFAVDSNQDAICFAQTHYRDKGLIFQKQDLAQLKFPANYFDLICCFEVLEHLKDYRRILKELWRVSKPKGILMISTPNKARYSSFSAKPFYPFHEHEFYLAEFKKILKDFQIRQILGQHGQNNIKLESFPRRLYSFLPSSIKKLILRIYLKLRFFLLRPPEQKAAKTFPIKFDDNLTKARLFVAICQKRERTDEKKI